MTDKLSYAAKELGAEHGIAAADRVITIMRGDVPSAKRIVDGYKTSARGVMDLCPEPLAGEWADDPLPMDILDKIANKVDPQDLRGGEIDMDGQQDILDDYEETYNQAFWQHLLGACEKMIKGAA